MSTSEIKCFLCTKELQYEDLLKMGKCNHMNCKKCFVDYVTNNLNVKIKCPIENCLLIVSDSMIRKCLSNDQEIIYDKLSINSVSCNLKKCPIMECPFMYITEENIGIFDCSYCESPICIKCNDIHYPQDCLSNLPERNTNHVNNFEGLPQASKVIALVLCLFAVLIYFVWFGWYFGIYTFAILLSVPLLYYFMEEYLRNIDFKDMINIINEVEQKPIRIQSQENDFQSRAIEKITKKRRDEFIEMDFGYDLLPNPTSYECMFCGDFILPRDGVILRNCLHCFCGQCLKDTYSNKNFTHQFKCQICNVKLQDKELRVLIEEKRFVAMIINEVSTIMYHCKKDNCDGICDVTTGKGSFPCPICASVNCVECEDIHSGMTCEDFRKTRKYVDSIKELAILKDLKHINCCNCKTVLIQKGGCGALHCDNCGNHICVFTGLFAGKHDSKKCGCWTLSSCPREGKYCECDAKEPCHTDCKYGCVPE